MQYAFYGCEKLTAILPKYELWFADILWENSSNTQTFSGCYNLIKLNNIPISWGGHSNDHPLTFDMEIEITDNNLLFSLPLHKTYDTINVDTGDTVVSSAYYDFTIDWGDGTTSSVKVDGNNEKYWNIDKTSKYYGYPQNFPTENKPNYEMAIKTAQHKYKNPGIYLISISAITFDTLYVDLSDTYTWKALRKLYSLGEVPFKSLNNAFANATNLRLLPNMDLITHTQISNESPCVCAKNMFYNCKRLERLPNNFKLSKYFIDMSYMFYNAFNYSLTYTDAYTSNIFSNGFYYNTIINLTSMFENCKLLTGFADGKLLWESKLSFFSNNMFKNCMNIYNIYNIPTEWGGMLAPTELDNPFAFTIKINSSNNFNVNLPVTDKFFNPFTHEYICDFIYDFRIDWGDESELENFNNFSESLTNKVWHTYSSGGEFTIKIYGKFSGWNIICNSQNQKNVVSDNYFNKILTSIINWGNFGSVICDYQFMNCINLTAIPKTELPLPLINMYGNTQSISYQYMFYGCEKLSETIFDTINIQLNKIDFTKLVLLDFTSLFEGCNAITKYPTGLYRFKQLLESYRWKNGIEQFYINYTSIFTSNNSNYTFNDRLKFAYTFNNFSNLCNISGNTEINKISLVQEIIPEFSNNNNKISITHNPGKYYIYPRAYIDDITNNQIFFKRPCHLSQNMCQNMYKNNNHITHMPDNQFKLIIDDFKEGQINEEFNYKLHICDYNMSEYIGGLYYVENSFNEETETFELEYQHDDLTYNRLKYKFYNSFPIAEKVSPNGIDWPLEWTPIDWGEKFVESEFNNDIINNNKIMTDEERLRFLFEIKNPNWGRIFNQSGESYKVNSISSKTIDITLKKTIIINETETEIEIKTTDYTSSFIVYDYYEQLFNNIDNVENITTMSGVNPILLTNAEYKSLTYLEHVILDKNWKTIGLNKLDTLFYNYCNKHIISLNGLCMYRNETLKTLENFELPNYIQDCSYMFYGCSNLVSIPSTFQFPVYCVAVASCFENCTALSSISNLDFESNLIIDYSNFNKNNIKLAELPVSGYYFNSSDIISDNMFYNCQLLSSITILCSNNYNTNFISYNNMFYNCVQLREKPEFLPNNIINDKSVWTGCILLKD